MKRITTYIFIAVTLLYIGVACKSTTAKKEADTNRQEYKIERNMVDVMTLKRGSFEKELISNGKLSAINRGELRFAENGVIKTIKVKNGDYVKAGGVIATLDKTATEHQLAEAQQQYRKAVIDFEDALIGFGYTSADTLRIPADKLKIAYTRSGFMAAKSALRQAQHKLDNCTMKAPFSGCVANILNYPYEEAKTPFCTILDDSSFEVRFPILETELSIVEVGQHIKISPFSNSELKYDGRVTSINPLIDKNGLVFVTAVVNGNKSLMDGMNIKVFVNKTVSNVLVVPKSAVVIRDNYQVLFKYDDQQHKSIWTYINVVMANSDSYVVTGHKEKNTTIKEGDNIIISGNLNLADGSEVEVSK